MPDATHCPTHDDLRRFLLGDVQNDEADHLEGHLSTCAGCLDTLAHLETHDVLLAAMQVQARDNRDPEADIVEGLMNRLSGLHWLPAARSPLADTRDSAGLHPGLATTADAAAATASQETAFTTNGRHGQFSIVKPHAQGGLGLVSIARDEKLHRQVALKEIRPERAADPYLRKRFINEAEITGQLEHPGIVPIYALDEDADDRPYYAMRFIQGRTLAEAIREHHARPTSLTIRELLQRFVTVCQTIAYAHSRGVIHRDLKPANVMLGEYGETLVVDWGLAKHVGSTATWDSCGESLAPDNTNDLGLTAAGQVLGTPSYMSPEQAAGHSADVGPPTDIYALGAILYEILAGEAPHRDVETLIEVFRRLASGTPPRSPSQLKPGVPRALEAVCGKAMAHSPADRYATARDLAVDIEKWLADEPVPCYREPWTARLVRWSRRHRTWVRAGAAALVLIAIVSTVAALLVNQKKEENALLARLADDRRIEAEERGQKAQFEWERAEGQLSRAEWLLYLSQITSAYREWQAGDAHAAWVNLNACRADLRGWEHDFLVTLFNKNQRTLQGHQYAVQGVAYSPDGTRVASTSHDKTLKIWDAATGEELLTLKGHADRVTCVAFSPSGDRIVSGGDDHTLRLWDAASGTLLHTLKGHSGKVTCVGFSPDGKQLASGSNDYSLRVWNAESAKLIRALQGHTKSVNALAFSPSNAWLASGCHDGSLLLWDTATGARVDPSYAHRGAIHCVAFSPDGKQIVTGGSDDTLKLWNVPTDANTTLPSALFELLPRTKRYLAPPVRTFRGHTDAVYSVAFRPDGKQIASGSADHMVKLWDVSTGELARTLQGHTDLVFGVAYSPDGKRLASTGCFENSLKLWDLESRSGPDTLSGHTAFVTSLAISRDGQRIVSGSGGRFKLWDTTTGRNLITGSLGWLTDDRVAAVCFSPDGTRFATGHWDKSLRIWDTETGQGVQTLTGHQDKVTAVAFSPDGKHILSGSYDHSMKLWDAATGQDLRTFTGHAGMVTSVAFSPDGRQVVSGSLDCFLKLWETATGSEIRTLRGHTSHIISVAFHPDGQRIASSGADLMLKLWNAQTGDEIHTMSGHSGLVNSVAFSPDGRRIVSGSRDLTLKLWDVKTGQATLTLPGHEGSINTVAFSPNGLWIVSAGEDKALKIWDASGGFQKIAPR